MQAAIAHMNTFGRIVACGMISQYNKPPEEAFGVTNLMQVVAKRLKMQGFIVRHPRTHRPPFSLYSSRKLTLFFSHRSWTRTWAPST